MRLQSPLTAVPYTPAPPIPTSEVFETSTMRKRLCLTDAVLRRMHSLKVLKGKLKTCL